MRKDRIDYLREVIKNNNISGNTDGHYMWNLCCVDYFFYNGNIIPQDIKSHWTDGTGDGGIDYIYYKKGIKDIYLIQGKDKKLDYDEITDQINHIVDTIKVFDAGTEVQYELNKKVKRAYRNALKDRKKKDITIVLFTNTIITDRLKERIELWKRDVFKEYNVEIYGVKEIEEKEAAVACGEKTVESGVLDCVDNNIVEYSYGDNSGIILNIKAKSLQKLFQSEVTEELFGYNLRDQIGDNKLHVDERIAKTIEKEKENFWFYNNGITIACSSFSIQNKKLSLKNFSIINGAQTTSVIGASKEINENNDFSIVCKVVKSPGSLDNNFIRQISVASNSQKEIEPRDLFSNSPEQIMLQYKFTQNENPLAVNIKRGVKPKNYDNVQSWQKIDNKYLGQIILAALLQQPGTARNHPNCIFDIDEDDNMYKRIFDMKLVMNYNYNVLYDLVRIQYLYEKHKKTMIKEKSNKKEKTKNLALIRKLQDEIGVLKNSGYTVISIIMYLIRRKYLNIPKVNYSSEESWNKFINKKIEGNLLLDRKFKDYKTKMNELFDEILNVLFRVYNDEVSNPSSNVTSPSNYFKDDGIYREKIVKAFDDNYGIDAEKFDENRLLNCGEISE